MTIPKFPRKCVDLDQPWQAGDPIPAPEALHRDGDTGWALWNEVVRQHDQKFAPTAPMPMAAPAATQLTRDEGRDAQPLFTLEAAMLLARRNNRVCPRRERWLELSALLPPRKTLRGMQQPPAPLTGAGWVLTPSITKRLCFREQIEWAERAGILETVTRFMQAMREEEWLHIGED